MKIAVPYDNGQVFQHFGHTERFKLFNIENGNIVVSSVVNTNGTSHGALANILKNLEVDGLICGGLGAGAKKALDALNIKVYASVTGDVDKAVEKLIAGTLEYSEGGECDHHGADGEHVHKHAHGGGHQPCKGCGQHHNKAHGGEHIK